MKRLLITGAGGSLGGVCRENLGDLAETVRLSDITEISDLKGNEEFVACDLGDKAGVEALVDGCDGIIHMGGQSTEGTWEQVNTGNIQGVYHLYEAARKTGCKRIVYASSNHAIGFYPQTQRLDADVRIRPDSFYGVSKVFGEAMASMYHDKFGIETASLRIGSCFPEPINHRMLSTWLSYDDLVRLIRQIFKIPRLGCPVIYGASNNDMSLWDNGSVAYLGWHPQDNAEAFRAKVEAAAERPAPDDPNSYYHGGAFASDGIHE